MSEQLSASDPSSAYAVSCLNGASITSQSGARFCSKRAMTGSDTEEVSLSSFSVVSTTGISDDPDIGRCFDLVGGYPSRETAW